MPRIYFDNSATTPLDPRVEEAMKPFLSDIFGNPSSLHNEGRKARKAMEHARELTASLLSARPEEVVFTASGTEADNMAIIGVLKAFKGQPFHLITSAIEHPAVLEVCRYLERCGAAVTYLPVEQDGIVRPELLEQAIRPETRLIS